MKRVRELVKKYSTSLAALSLCPRCLTRLLSNGGFDTCDVLFRLTADADTNDSGGGASDLSYLSASVKPVKYPSTEELR